MLFFLELLQTRESIAHWSQQLSLVLLGSKDITPMGCHWHSLPNQNFISSKGTTFFKNIVEL